MGTVESIKQFNTGGKSIPWTPCLKKAQISTEIYINTGQITSEVL